MDDPLNRLAQQLADAWDWEEATNVQKLEDQFFDNSEPYFSSILTDLTQSNVSSIGSFDFRICQETSQLHALAYPRRRWLRRRSFDIVITQGLYNLFFQLSRLYHFTSLVTTINGRIVAPPVMTYGRAVCMCGKAVLDFVEEGKGNVSPDFPVWLNVQRRIDKQQSLMRRNSSFGIMYQQHMTLFVLAHEIGHAINGHLDMQPARTPEEAWAREYVADQVATNLHANWVHARLERTKNPQSPNTEEFLRWRRDFAQSQAMGGAAFAFGVWEIAESFAKDLGQDWRQSHPPSSERYSRYRTLAASSFGVGPDFFEKGEYFGPNPSRSLDFLNGLASKIRMSGSINEIRKIDSLWSEVFVSNMQAKEFLSKLGQTVTTARQIGAVSKLPLVEAQVCRDVGVIAMLENCLSQAAWAFHRASQYSRKAVGASFSEQIDARDVEASALERLGYLELNRGKQTNAIFVVGGALDLLRSLASDGHLWAAERIIKLGELVHNVAMKGTTGEQEGELLKRHWGAITTSLEMSQDLPENTVSMLLDIRNRMELFFRIVGIQLDDSQATRGVGDRPVDNQ
jgi:hypothetical protein